MKQTDILTEAVEKYINGDESAFNVIYEESYRYLYTCVIHVVKDEDNAQDTLQNTYIEIVKYITQLKESQKFLSWASMIANRKAFAAIKQNKDVLVDGVDVEGEEYDFFEQIADDEALIPENIFDDSAKIKIIREIIDDLSDIQRACVIGFYYNEQKQDEIAEELGIPVNTVKSHLNRAKAKIKEAVGDVEKKQGIKLYSFAPFMLLLFVKEVEAYAGLTVPAMGAQLTTAVAAGAKATAGAVKGKAVASGVKAAVTTVKTKIAIGVVASTVTVAGITGAYIAFNSSEPEVAEPVVEVEEVIVEEPTPTPIPEPEKPEDYLDFSMTVEDFENLITIKGEPLSTFTYEDFMSMCEEANTYPVYSEVHQQNTYPVNILTKEINNVDGGGISTDGLWLEYQKIDDENFSYLFRIQSDSERIDHGYDYKVTEPLDKGNKSVKEFIDEIDPNLYEMLFKYEWVYFDGGKVCHTKEEGTLTRGDGTTREYTADNYQFSFNEIDTNKLIASIFVSEMTKEDNSVTKEIRIYYY